MIAIVIAMGAELVIQAGGLSLAPLEPTWSWGQMLVILQLGRQRDKQPWASLANHPSLLGELQANERPYLTKQRR